MACNPDNCWRRSDVVVAPVARVRGLVSSVSSAMGVSAPRGHSFAASLDTQIPH